MNLLKRKKRPAKMTDRSRLMNGYSIPMMGWLSWISHYWIVKTVGDMDDVEMGMGHTPP